MVNVFGGIQMEIKKMIFHILTGKEMDVVLGIISMVYNDLKSNSKTISNTGQGLILIIKI